MNKQERKLREIDHCIFMIKTYQHWLDIEEEFEGEHEIVSFYKKQWEARLKDLLIRRSI